MKTIFLAVTKSSVLFVLVDWLSAYFGAQSLSSSAYIVHTLCQFQLDRFP
jgi:hypothetical protein